MKGGRARHRSEVKVVHNFGRAEELDPQALRRLVASILRVLDGERAPGSPAALGGARSTLLEGFDLLPARGYGGIHLVRVLWERVGLGEILRRLAPRRRNRAPHDLALLAMVANRLLAPSSKLGCYERWLAEEVHFPEGGALRLSQLYAALDFLVAHGEAIEKELFFSIADLFSLDVDLIFFDTTTVYFEIDEEDEEAGGEAKALRRRGHSKDDREGNPQVVVALALTRDGLPVRSLVFPGNAVDVTLIARVRRDLKDWRLSRVLFVGDAGVYSEQSLKVLASGGGRYLVATPLRKLVEVREEVLSRAGRYQELGEALAVKEVVVGDGEARRRYFVCLNRQEAERTRCQRERVLEILAGALEALGGGKADHPKRACELRASRRFGPYLCQDGRGRLSIDREKVEADSRFDGKWVVTTNDDTLSAQDGALGYKAMAIIEGCFRRLKTTGLKIRPIYHWTPERIVAHVKLCVLALLLERVAERACQLPWRRIRAALDRIQVVPCQTPSGTFLRTTRPSPEALAFLKQLAVEAPPRLPAVLPKAKEAGR